MKNNLKGSNPSRTRKPRLVNALQSDIETIFYSRRSFLKKSALMALSTALGAEIVHAASFPEGLLPIALLESEVPWEIPGKDPGLRILNDRPLNAETPAHLLDDLYTPASRLFVRNNGIPPEGIDPEHWSLEIGGEAAKQNISLSLKELQNKFPTQKLQLTLECGGNGRAEFNPPAKGNQWSTGAVGSPIWTGVRLKDVLEYVGITPEAVYIGYYGKDRHLSQDPNKVPISRGVPMHKALEEESLLAWAINDQDLPLHNGFPLRLVFGGWPASCSGKWLHKIVIRDRIHDGPKMGGQSYRVPCETVAPGAKVSDEKMCIIESMPVKSLLTYPKSGAIVKLGQRFEVRGKAWAGDLSVKSVQLSTDFGATWQPAELSSPRNRLAWQPWRAELSFSKRGYYEIWARATDSKGRMQPMVIPGWNPKGYLNNACHRIAIKVS